MSSYVYMKVLESTPLRYDRGIRLLSRGAIDGVYERLATLAAAPGRRVLDVGCGTGNLALACVAKGSLVVGIDGDAGMLEVARDKARDRADRLELVELNALQLEDRFAEGSFDAAVSCLLFSELSPDERRYLLATLRRLVKPGGLVAVAEEVMPSSSGARAWWKLKRAPLVTLTWLLTQTTTHPVEELEASFHEARLASVTSERLAGDFILVTGICEEVS
ncbi:MAG: class I SAM-dependent methyltransferase [Myxococcales bacterium]|nr:class I SAM-dependent methyltransferase [Myxococcales bacterium]